MVIVTTGDPATPYESAQELNKLLTDSLLVSLTSEGPTCQGHGNTRVYDQVDDSYLLGIYSLLLVCRKQTILPELISI